MAFQKLASVLTLLTFRLDHLSKARCARFPVSDPLHPSNPSHLFSLHSAVMKNHRGCPQILATVLAALLLAGCDAKLDVDAPAPAMMADIDARYPAHLRPHTSGAGAGEVRAEEVRQYR